MLSPHKLLPFSTSQRLGNFPAAPQSVNLLYLHIWPATCPRHMAQLNRHPLHQSGSPHDLKVTSQVGRGTWLPLHHLLENPSGRHRNYCIDPWQDSDETPVFTPTFVIVKKHCIFLKKNSIFWRMKICIFCETQPPASIDWVALSSMFVCSLGAHGYQIWYSGIVLVIWSIYSV